jgi:hypothetical protein
LQASGALRELARLLPSTAQRPVPVRRLIAPRSS